MTFQIAAAVSAALAFAAITAADAAPAQAAHDQRLTEEQRARFEQNLEDIRARLRLSEEQRAQLEPVLRKSFEQRTEILQRYGVSRGGSERLGFRKARALKSDLENVRKANEAEVAKILDPAQMTEYRKIQEEMREEIRQRLRARRS